MKVVKLHSFPNQLYCSTATRAECACKTCCMSRATRSRDLCSAASTCTLASDSKQIVYKLCLLTHLANTGRAASYLMEFVTATTALGSMSRLRSANSCYEQPQLAKLLYCSPAWSGFCSAADRARLNAFLRRCQRLGYCSRETPAITELFDGADETLFGSILANSNHVLQSYLPERSLSQYNLRLRAHTKELLNKTTELNHRDFFIRMLYKDCY